MKQKKHILRIPPNVFLRKIKVFEALLMSVTVFTWQKRISGFCKTLLSFAFKTFYFIYMCLILHVSMSIGFFVFYNSLHSLVYLSLHISCVIVQGVSCQIITFIILYLKGQSHSML